MGKVNSSSTGKVWENTEIMQTFKNYEIQQKSINFPKHRKIVFPQCGKIMGKYKYSKGMGFLHI